MATKYALVRDGISASSGPEARMDIQGAVGHPRDRRGARRGKVDYIQYET